MTTSNIRETVNPRSFRSLSKSSKSAAYNSPSQFPPGDRMPPRSLHSLRHRWRGKVSLARRHWNFLKMRKLFFKNPCGSLRADTLDYRSDIFLNVIFNVSEQLLGNCSLAFLDIIFAPSSLTFERSEASTFLSQAWYRFRSHFAS